MSNFNLNDFFAAFNSLKARGSATVKSTTSSSSSCGSCHQQDQKPAMPAQFECRDEDVQLSGWHCRHTPVETPQPTCTCPPRPTCPPQPTQPTCPCPQPTQPTCPCPQPTQPTCPCPQPTKPQPQPIMPPTQNNVNFGIIDGPGNDIYAMGNRGIIDTDGNDIYARNYNVNTFNTTNNFYPTQTTPAPTPTTPEPTPTEPDPTPTTPGPTSPTEPPTVDLMPLRSLLTGIDAIRTPDNVISDKELSRAMSNSTIADMDGDPTKISSEEMAIFNAIKAFNEDKDLISSVIKGDYSNIDEAKLNSLFELSERIRTLTKY